MDILVRKDSNGRESLLDTLHQGADGRWQLCEDSLENFDLIVRENFQKKIQVLDGDQALGQVRCPQVRQNLRAAGNASPIYLQHLGVSLDRAAA